MCGHPRDRGPRQRTGAKTYPWASRRNPFLAYDVLAKTEARMVVARSSGSGTLSDLRKRDSPQNSANGWIRGNVVKVIVSRSFRTVTAIVMGCQSENVWRNEQRGRVFCHAEFLTIVSSS